jgi:hypothetical protein
MAKLFEGNILNKLIYFFLVLCIIMPCFSSISYSQDTELVSGNTVKTDIKTLFPMEKGMKWRYERKSRQGVSRFSTNYLGSVTDNNIKYQLLGNPYGISYFEITPDILYLRGVAPADDPRKVNYYIKGESIRLKEPLIKGNRWHDNILLTKESGTIATGYTTEILGWEKITVPAGTFDALVTSSTLNTIFLNKSDGSAKCLVSNEKIWYSPDNGIVRRLAFIVYGKERVLHRDDRLEVIVRENKK